MTVQEMARLGGFARAAALTKQQRIDSARKAGQANKGKPKGKRATPIQ